MERINDIVERIRKLRFVHIPGTSDLMEEACQEIERLRQFDRSQPIKPAEDTPATHATPCGGTSQGEGTLPNAYRENDEKRGVSDTKRGPVAWAVVYPTGDAGVLCFFRRDAEDIATASDRVVPLYRSPTLTDEEREAIAWCLSLPVLDRDIVRMMPLRSLLERLK